MARKVYDADMVCHIWANRGQDEARTSSNNLFFVGPTLYSYGRHFVIGHFLDDGRVLLNAGSYSNTTSKHQSKAHQALRGVVVRDALYLPSLNDDDVRNLASCRNGPRAGKKPDVVVDLEKAVVDDIRSMSKMRSREKMSGVLSYARRRQDTGLALLEYVKQKGKKPLKWGLPMLPETLPDTRAGIDELIRTIAKSQILESYRDSLAKMQDAFITVRATIDNAADLPFYRLQNLRGMYEHQVCAAIHTTNRLYMSAMGRNMPGLKKLQADAAAIESMIDPVIRAGWIETIKDEFNRAVQVYSRFMHAGEKQRIGMHFSRSLERMREYAARYDGFTGMKPWADFVARVSRHVEWFEVETIFTRMDSRLNVARSYRDSGRITARDAALEYRDVIKACETVRRHPQFYRLHAQTVDTAETEAREFVAHLDALIAAENAQIIAAWIAGASNVRPPYDAGTFARIKGDLVETSKGATVPLQHACRLARIARRVIAHGGKEWANGEGPRVGHFQVNRIGADSSATIGCHEFSAHEGGRLLALLEACPTCAGVSDEMGV